MCLGLTHFTVVSSESAAINVCKYLLDEHANVVIYDPKVSEKQIHYDLVSSDVYGGNGQDLEHGQSFPLTCFHLQSGNFLNSPNAELFCGVNSQEDDHYRDLCL